MIIVIFFIPGLEKVSSLMVVDSYLTNDLHKNYAQLSIATDFNRTKAVEWIIGDQIELIEYLGTVFYGTEVSSEHFTFTETPIPNKPSPPTLYGWISKHYNGSFNLVCQKEFNTNAKIHKHPIFGNILITKWKELDT